MKRARFIAGAAAGPTIAFAGKVSASESIRHFIPFQIYNIAGCVAIDSAGVPPDNGALACERIAWPNHHDCNDIPSAVNDMLSCSNQQGGGGLMAIVGHGAAGLQACGGGQNPTWNLCIATWDEDTWKPLFSQLQGKNFAILTLFGCDVGATQDGAQLLFDMAKTIGKPARARTGLVSCGGNGQITFEPNSTWQIADPTMSTPPAPIPQPSVRGLRSVDRLYFPMGTRETVSQRSVSRIEIAFPHNLREVQSPGKPIAVFESASEVRSILREVNFSLPYATGHLPAIPSATLRITYRTAASSRTRTFVVYNDRALQDVAAPSFTYFATKTMSRFLAGARSVSLK
jgi:hypothetical protein